jgi:hypothetical protein
MRSMPSKWLRLLLLAPLVTAAGAAAAVEISYSAFDVADAQPGHDLWRYTYRLDAFPHSAGYGFTVFFDPTSYGALDPPPPAGSGWDVLVVPPDPLLEDGYYDAEAFVDNPPVSSAFSVVFEWLGPGVPGAQPFVVRDPSLAAIEEGTTVPEPAAAARRAVALVGLAALAFGRRAGEGVPC